MPSTSAVMSTISRWTALNKAHIIMMAISIITTSVSLHQWMDVSRRRRWSDLFWASPPRPAPHWSGRSGRLMDEWFMAALPSHTMSSSCHCHSARPQISRTNERTHRTGWLEFASLTAPSTQTAGRPLSSLRDGLTLWRKEWGEAA